VTSSGEWQLTSPAASPSIRHPTVSVTCRISREGVFSAERYTLDCRSHVDLARSTTVAELEWCDTNHRFSHIAYLHDPTMPMQQSSTNGRPMVNVMDAPFPWLLHGYRCQDGFLNWYRKEISSYQCTIVELFTAQDLRPVLLYLLSSTRRLLSPLSLVYYKTFETLRRPCRPSGDVLWWDSTATRTCNWRPQYTTAFKHKHI